MGQVNCACFLSSYWYKKTLCSKQLHCESKKTEPNFRKYSLILIILSLLDTEINCNQVYPKIYHQTPNLQVHYLVKWTEMLLAWFRK